MSILLWPKGAPYAKGECDEDQPSIQTYLVDSFEQKGAVIVCPGGGYWLRAEHEGEPVAKWLNRLGISAFVLNYRVAPYKHPAPLLDAQRALRYVRHHAKKWHIDPKRIGILGFSAGGHLASTVGTHFDNGDPEAADPVERESCRPDLMVLSYSVISLKAPYGHEGSRMNLLGEQADEKLSDLLSNELQVTAETPPTFLWHTADDDVRVENSLNFARSLSQYDIPFDLHVYQHGAHGLGLAEEDPHVGTWTSLCELWLKRNGF